MGKISIRKRGKYYEYRIEISQIEGKRQWLSKSGFMSKNEAYEAGTTAYNEYLTAGTLFKTCNMSYSDYLNYWIENYYPISIYCPKCKKDTTKISNYNLETGEVTYSCSCGHNDALNINNADNIKLQWKVDWPMRWMVENVTFETGGIDHSAANGSKAVSERVAREICNYEPPVYIPYNFIGIKGGGAKMSSSKGNVLTITDLLKVYDKNIIWWFYARFDNMHAFDIALDNDVIRYYSEFDRWVKLYFNGNIDDKNRSILDLTNVKENYLKYPNFSYLATFLPIVNFDIELLKELPTEIELPKGMEDEDEISDWLTEQVGFCHKGFFLED